MSSKIVNYSTLKFSGLVRSIVKSDHKRIGVMQELAILSPLSTENYH